MQVKFESLSEVQETLIALRERRRAIIQHAAQNPDAVLQIILERQLARVESAGASLAAAAREVF